MALANFFDKTALAAAEVLAGFDYASFRSKLEALVIGVAFDINAVSTKEGRCSLELVLNLFSRIYPRLSLIPLDHPSNGSMEWMKDLVIRINPELSIEPPGIEASATLVVGSKSSSLPNSVYIGSDRWHALFSPTSPQGSLDSNNPFGAAAASCVGVANIFRSVFKTQLFEGALDNPLRFSVLEQVLCTAEARNPEIQSCELPTVPLIGLGAIGNGAVFVLSRLTTVQGELNLIDPEKIEISNLQRYVLAEQKHIGELKVSVAKSYFRNSLVAYEHSADWGEYFAQHRDKSLDVVAISVDSAGARCEAQACLPKWIVNAWTQPLDLGISRHKFADEYACLTCLYLPREKSLNEDEIIARAIGLEGNLMVVRQMLALNTPVSEEFLLRLAELKGVPPGPLLPFVGRSLREFYSRAVCGGLLLSLDPTGQLAAEPVPMAFQSALAGILMAAELIAHASGLKDSPPPVTTRVNLLQPLGKHFNQLDRKPTEQRCICQDNDYLAAFRSKYLVSS